MVTLQDRARSQPASSPGLRGDELVTGGGLRGRSFQRDGGIARPSRTAIAIGHFDGVHRGHQSLLSRTRRAAPPDAAVGAVTFDRHPMSVLAPDREPAVITTLEDKVARLLACNLDFVVVLTVEPALLATSPQDFVDDLLVATLNSAVVAVGPNFRFGRGAAAGPDLLQRLGPTSGFAVVIPTLEKDGDTVVSSTAVRRAIADGDLAAAVRLLGRPLPHSSPVREEEKQC